ncbi:MAG: hypothetical protein M1839_001141 [Geoglossum umbratile]|nr:MAG: hypothetical protein M1839_001141 [Geoglossum umbratile]
MPYIPHTPESLLPRSDSKNPSTTCRGVTSSGRPCRRSLAASPGASPSRSSPGSPGLVAIVSEDDGEASGFFCWQHKDQAEKTVASGRGALRRGGDSKTGATYQQRTSIDTLVDRIGILDVGKATKFANAGDGRTRRSGRRGKKAPSLLSIFCCIEYDSSDNDEPKIQPSRAQNNGHQSKGYLRPKDTPTARLPQRPPLRSQIDARDLDRIGPMRTGHTTPISTNVPRPLVSEGQKRVSTGKTLAVGASIARQTAQQLARPSLPRDPSTQTAYLLSLIPKHLSPQTTSLLLAELAKPISENDDEGYIYIFWLTDSDTTAAPSPKAVSALLSHPSTPYSHRHGRPSEVLRAASTNNDKKNTILLKIGRASNVHRRLNEWTRQCGYNLSLIRYYPHVPSSPVPSPSASPPRSPPITTPRKVPYAHRVERLIHIELADKRVKQDLCGKCGKDHREWFAIDASREGLKAVDEVVRRWVGWGEMRGGA